MDYKQKYLKYKQKYLELKQFGGVIECSDEINFINNMGSCWNIAILMILIFGDKSNKIFQRTLEKSTSKIVSDAKQKLISFLPDYCLDPENTNKLSYKTKTNIYNIVDILKTKLNILKNKKNKTYIPEKLKTRESICELNFLNAYYNILYDKDYTIGIGGNEYDNFFLVNLLSILFLNKYIDIINIMEYSQIKKPIDMKQINRSYGMLVDIPGHAMCFYTCRMKQLFCNNDHIYGFNWKNMLLESNTRLTEGITPYINFNNISDRSDVNMFSVDNYKYSTNFVMSLYVLIDYVNQIDSFKQNNLFNYFALNIIRNDFIGTSYVIHLFESVDYDINTRHNNITLLYLAVQYKNERLVKILLSNGANTEFTYNNEYILMLAMTVFYNKNIIKLLINNGANINVENNAPLKEAISNRNIEVIELLIDNGADINIIYKGVPLLIYFIKNRKFNATEKISIITKLLDKGIDVNFTDRSGISALQIAIRDNNINIIKLLIDKSANINIEDNAPLKEAISSRNIKVIELLIENGSNIDIIYENEPLLIYFIKNRFFNDNDKISIITKLLDKGIDINFTDKNGDSALHIAVKYTNIPIVKLLLDKGIDIDLIDNSGKTALTYANDEIKNIINSYINK